MPPKGEVRTIFGLSSTVVKNSGRKAHQGRGAVRNANVHGGNLPFIAVISGDVVFIGSADGNLYALD